MKTASSPRARQALSLVEALQQRFVNALGAEDFARLEWLRDEGRHGGGVRFACAETERFNRASVNVSCVHYDDEPQRKLASATALSTIIHPRHPRVPSVHMHFSLTELREGPATWRLMADLNPSHPDASDTAAFEAAMRSAAPNEYELARAQGDRYFFIPALGRTRGVTHFYLEEFVTEPGFVQRFAETMMDAYAALFGKSVTAASPQELEAQRAYHTLYLFQVLTLDRGTTSGLLVHDQNDLGTMGSLPSVVDRSLLASWEAKVPKPQDELVRALVAAMPDDRVTDEVRMKLAAIVRAHYRKHPEAMALQAASVLSERSRGHVTH